MTVSFQCELRLATSPCSSPLLSSSLNTVRADQFLLLNLLIFRREVREFLVMDGVRSIKNKSAASSENDSGVDTTSDGTPTRSGSGTGDSSEEDSSPTASRPCSAFNSTAASHAQPQRGNINLGPSERP